MKKQIFRFFLVLWIVFGLLPAALATERDDAAGSIFISDCVRTDGGLSCEVELKGFQSGSGDVFWAAVFEESNGVPGKMKQLIPLSTAGNPVSVTLDNVSDTDFVRLMWLDKNGVVRDCRTVARPAGDINMASGLREASGADFDRQVLQLLHRESANAATEKALEEAAEQNPYAYKRLIVKSSEKLPDLSRYGNPLVIYNPATGHSVIQFTDENNSENCAEYLQKLNFVRYVEPDRLMKSGPKSSGPYLDMSTSFHSWGVREMKADVLAGALQQKSGLSGVVVAVADTGVQTDHPFLQGRLTNGFDFIENDSDPQDQHSHGTHVAGTIVDCTPGLDIKIMPIRVLGASGGGTSAGIAMGIRYAVSNGANVINLSLGGGHSNYIDEAIEEAIARGVTVVTAAGNEGGNVAEHCPAHVANAITVGAVDHTRNKASFSNSGAALDIVAPGVGIKSSILNGQFGEKNGTSMAAPHITAAAAMLKYGYPDKTPEEIQQALKDTAIDLGESGRDDDYGYGFPNLEKFVDGWPSGRNTEPDPSNPDEPKTGLFALLYEDGELVFQNTNQAHRDTPVLDTYSIVGELPNESGTYSGGYFGSESGGGNGAKYSAWYDHRQDITKVTILDKMKPTSVASWFRGCANMQSVTGMENLSTSLTTDMSYMFAGCRALTELNLYEFNTADVTDMRYMFYNCVALTKIRVAADTFNTDKVTDSVNMFTGAEKLTGGQGTVYDAAHTDVEYARIDGGQSSPGYFTATATVPDSVHLTAVLYDDGELVFQPDETPAPGRNVVQTYVTDLQGFGDNRDTCAWHNEAAQIKTVIFSTPIQPQNIAKWFQDCYNLTAIRNLENLDTASVHDMSMTFAKCASLTELDLSAFDTSSVTDMNGMFKHCFHLTELDLSSFDTAHVVRMRDMFHGCENLQTIYVSGKFDTGQLAGVANGRNMFMDCLKLTGGNGTAYDENQTNAAYARIDGGTTNPGYFTKKT